jgi:hypothetical protein
MDTNYQPRLDALVIDLENHQPQAAANLLRDELFADPRAAMQMIRDARTMTSPNADHAFVAQNGNVVVEDPRMGAIVAGNMNQGGRESAPVPAYPPAYYGQGYPMRPGLGLSLPLVPGLGIQLNLPLFGHGGHDGNGRR